MNKYNGTSLLKMSDLTAEDIRYYIDLALVLKNKKHSGVPHELCKGKNVALLFEKTSTRTRCAFEVAAADLGMHAVYLDPKSSQMGQKESIEDTAKVLGRMFDGIEYRGFGQEIVENLAKFSGVPVWNGLTDEAHPTQVLADFMTIEEHFGDLKGRKLVFIGDAGFNMGNSLMMGCAIMGMDYVGCSPRKYSPRPELLEEAKLIGLKTGAKIEIEEDPYVATKNADVIYTDVWLSMGEPDYIWKERITDLSPYRVTSQLMANAKPTCVFMHCLPAFHDLKTDIGVEMFGKFGVKEMEVTDEVFRSPASIVFDEAENRLHTIKAVMAASLAK